MGQAKQRKAEILKLKIQPKLLGFGAFYKDNQDEGVSIMWNGLAQPEVKDLLKTLYPATEHCFEAELKEIQTGNFQYFNGATSKEEAIANIWAQLQDLIHDYNVTAFGTSIRPQKHFFNIEVNAEMLKIAMPIMSNIWLLQELGEIPLDNFNGMHFIYGT
jgi:hypothetical protein